MSSGSSVGIATGLSGSQMNINQLLSALVASENERRIEKELETDFFVGPNGKTLPGSLKKWIGTSRREHLLKHAKDAKLKNAINQLYRPGSFIGDGGTASVIKFEKATGIGLGRNGKKKKKKGKEMIHYINTKILTQESLSPSDRRMANRLVKALKKAMWRNK